MMYQVATVLLLSSFSAAIASANAGLSCSIDNARMVNRDNSAWVCSSTNQATIQSVNGELAHFNDGLYNIPMAVELYTGGLCRVILETQGYECFQDVMTLMAEHFLPVDSSQLDTFNNASKTSFKGQAGNCYTWLYQFNVTGLSTEQLILAKSLRDGEVVECQIDGFSNRLYMSGLWSFYIALGYMINAIVLMLTFLTSIIGSALAIVIVFGCLCCIPYGLSMVCGKKVSTESS